MHQEHHHWYSGRVGREMGIRVHGHYGSPLLVFPTSGGDEWEYEGQGMVEALAGPIDAGRVKLFCVNTVNNESWYNKHAHPGHRSYVQAMYDAYLALEVVPFIEMHCQSPGITITTTGSVLRRVPRREHAAEAPRPVPAVPGPVRRLRPEAVHGRALRRQLLLQQPGRLRARTWPTAGTCTTCSSATSTWPPATAPGRTAGRRTGWPRSCASAASRTPWTTGAPTAGTTGPSGSTRWASTLHAFSDGAPLHPEARHERP